MNLVAPRFVSPTSVYSSLSFSRGRYMTELALLFSTRRTQVVGNMFVACEYRFNAEIPLVFSFATHRPGSCLKLLPFSSENHKNPDP